MNTLFSTVKCIENIPEHFSIRQLELGFRYLEVGRIYYHFKKEEPHKILSFSLSTDLNNEEFSPERGVLVVYKSCVTGRTWVRTLGEFASTVDKGGEIVNRFSLGKDVIEFQNKNSVNPLKVYIPSTLTRHSPFKNKRFLENSRYRTPFMSQYPYGFYNYKETVRVLDVFTFRGDSKSYVYFYIDNFRYTQLLPYENFMETYPWIG